MNHNYFMWTFFFPQTLDWTFWAHIYAKQISTQLWLISYEQLQLFTLATKADTNAELCSCSYLAELSGACAKLYIYLEQKFSTEAASAAGNNIFLK
jgi:hypothetical protein